MSQILTEQVAKTTTAIESDKLVRRKSKTRKKKLLRNFIPLSNNFIVARLQIRNTRICMYVWRICGDVCKTCSGRSVRVLLSSYYICTQFYKVFTCFFFFAYNA